VQLVVDSNGEEAKCRMKLQW